MASSNRTSGEFMSPVPTSGQLKPGEVTVNHTVGSGLLLKM